MNKRTEYWLQLQRDYDEADLAGCEYLELSPRTQSWGLFRDDTTGFIKLDVSQLDNSVDFGLAAISRYVVPDRVKRRIESGDLNHVIFRATLLADPDKRLKGVPDGIAWEQWGPPWWEIASDYALPPVSPVMELYDQKRDRIAPGKPDVSYVRTEGSYLWPELHYRRSDLVGVQPFDLAHTLENFGGVLRWNERVLVASQRFYRFCVEHELTTNWIPVHVDDA